MGANMAENNPVGLRFGMQAREPGATVIHVAPRFSRSSAMSDVHVPLRAGSGVVLLVALITCVVNDPRWRDDDLFIEYVTHYSTAPVLVRDDVRDTEDLAGVFSGYDAAHRRYATDT